VSEISLSVRLDAIQSRPDLVEFIEAMLSDLKSNPDQWENADLTSFLDAMAAWINDMDGFYQNHGKQFSEDQSWKLFAEILFASRIYE